MRRKHGQGEPRSGSEARLPGGSEPRRSPRDREKDTPEPPAENVGEPGLSEPPGSPSPPASVDEIPPAPESPASVFARRFGPPKGQG